MAFRDDPRVEPEALAEPALILLDGRRVRVDITGEGFMGIATSASDASRGDSVRFQGNSAIEVEVEKPRPVQAPKVAPSRVGSLEAREGAHEDLTQETYLRALRALPSFAGRSSARTSRRSSSS